MPVRAALFCLWTLLAFSGLTAQNKPGVVEFSLAVERVGAASLPALHSFASAQWDGKWILIGGRTDGLHPREPFASFPHAHNNATAHLVDPKSWRVWSRKIEGLPDTLLAQLQSSNMQSLQEGDKLYLVGGYAGSGAGFDHRTFPYLTEVNLPKLAACLQKKELPFDGIFRQRRDERMAVCGGQLAELDGAYYLVGGHRFDGAYNPTGPDHGPGFEQRYTDEVRRFSLAVDRKGNPLIVDYTAWQDTQELHRRDFNLVPQRFPDGKTALTAFSGVFRYGRNLPWSNLVDIRPEGYASVPNSFQFLNHYHCPRLPVYNPRSGSMHTVFFGGIARYFVSPDKDRLLHDTLVPFVKTIGKMTRLKDGSMAESAIWPELPDFLGTAAHFFPAGPYFDENGILMLDRLPDTATVTVGYLYGGIVAQQPNVFWLEPADMSRAESAVYAVRLSRSTARADELVLTPNFITGLVLRNDKEANILQFDFLQPDAGFVLIQLLDKNGLVVQAFDGTQIEGYYTFDFDMTGLPSAKYTLRIFVNGQEASQSFQW